MNYYIIGIGGTGAKCVEALTHLCAVGLMPDGELYSVFVDPDKSNGSLERAESTLQNYTDCRRLQFGSTDLFKTRITISRPDVWSPLGDDPKSLDVFLQYDDLRLTNPPAAGLFDVLYSPDEKKTSLKEGFRGHPSIGAAVMATTLTLGAGEPWETFRDRVATDVKTGTGARIVLVGSIFGGTGASGMPTIARLIREELKTIQETVRTGAQQESLRVGATLGGVLMLPYFSFPPVHGEDLRADAENFLLNTQAALKYYYQQDDLGTYDAVYLLGEEVLSPMGEPSIGGKNQKNEPHFIELYAALGCIDFFTKGNVTQYQFLGRKNPDKLTWSDLPHPEGAESLKRKIDRFTRFAFAFDCAYYPVLEHIRTNGTGYRAPWYVNFFEREKLSLSKSMDKELPHLKTYCERFLAWLANIQSSATKLQVDLVNFNAFAKKERSDGNKEVVALLPAHDFRTWDFEDLTLPLIKADPHALSRLWERVCDATVNDANATGVGKFANALYRECTK